MDVQNVGTADAILTLELQPQDNLNNKLGKFFPREFIYLAKLSPLVSIFIPTLVFHVKAFGILCPSKENLFPNYDSNVHWVLFLIWAFPYSIFLFTII